MFAMAGYYVGWPALISGLRELAAFNSRGRSRSQPVHSLQTPCGPPGGQFAHCHNSTFRPSSQDAKRYFLSASAKESHALSWISLIAPSNIKSHALSGHPAGFRP